MQQAASPHRRTFFRHATALALAGVAAPAIASLAPQPSTAPAVRRLAFEHLHTGERLDVVYAEDGGYLKDALGAVNRLLRDHYSGEVGTIEPALLDQLHQVRQSLGSTRPFQVISGYRAPATNAHLRESRGGGVAKNSLHMEGRAIDVRLPGLELAQLRDAALALRAGGVGYYPRERFVHLDTGAVRRW